MNAIKDESRLIIEACQGSVEAFEVLEAALAHRPEDGVLALFAADFYGRYSQFEKASKLLGMARSHSGNASWHRAAASLSNYRNQKLTGLLHWRDVLAIEPLAHDAIRAIALLLAETEGRQSALNFLNELCQRFPCSCPLLALRVQWIKESGPREVLPYVRALLEVNPADAWAWRELAMEAKAAGEISEARHAAEALEHAPKPDILIVHEIIDEHGQPCGRLERLGQWDATQNGYVFTEVAL